MKQDLNIETYKGLEKRITDYDDETGYMETYKGLETDNGL